MYQAQATTSSSSSSSKAPSQVPELYSQDYLEKEAKARRIFRKLAREYHEKHEMPNQEALDQLNSYNEMLRDKFVGWRDEVSESLRVEFFEGRLRFLEYPTAPHDQVSRLFGDLFNETMGVPFPLHLHPFIADGTTGIALPLTVLLTMADVMLLNGDQLQPDAAFRLWNPRIPGIATQPDGRDYPCVVFEMANSERMVDMLRKCELWLSDQTSVNVWIGVSYERTNVVGDRTGDRWWMGVARRDFNAIAAGRPANLPANALWPSPVWLFSLPHGGRITALAQVAGALLLVSTAQHAQWSVPINVITHPLQQIPPPLPPPAPQQMPPLILHPEDFRTYIERNCLP